MSMNPYLKIKKYLSTRTINKQIKKQIIIVKMQRKLAECDTSKMSIEDQLKAMLIVAYLPMKYILFNMLRNRRRIIKSLNK